MGDPQPRESEGMAGEQGVVGYSMVAGQVLDRGLGRAGGTQDSMAVAADHSACCTARPASSSLTQRWNRQLCPASLTHPHPTCGQLRAVFQLAGCRSSELFSCLQRTGEEPRLLLAVQSGLRHAGSVHSAASLCGRICGGGVKEHRRQVAREFNKLS